MLTVLQKLFCRLRFFRRYLHSSSRSRGNKSARRVCAGCDISWSDRLSFSQGFPLDFSGTPSRSWKGARPQAAPGPGLPSAGFGVQGTPPLPLGCPASRPFPVHQRPTQECRPILTAPCARSVRWWGKSLTSQWQV